MNTAEIRALPIEILIKKIYREEWICIFIGFSIPLFFEFLWFVYLYRFMPDAPMYILFVVKCSLVVTLLIYLICRRKINKLQKYYGAVSNGELKEKLNALKKIDDEQVWKLFLSCCFWGNAVVLLCAFYIELLSSVLIGMIWSFFIK